MSAPTWSAPTSHHWTPAEEPPYVHWWLDHEMGQGRDFTVTRFRVPPLEDVPERYLKLPLSRHTLHKDLHQPGSTWDRAFDAAEVAGQFSPAQIGTLPANTVLVGVIDVGIPLCHRRTRLADGGTRILASWQQACGWGGQDCLPFGRELYAGDIDRMLCQCGADEDAFNLRAGLVERNQPHGPRDLDHRTSHGAHVLDLAAGYPEGQPAENIRILAVNLPPLSMHGSAGNFITHFAGLAMHRMFCLAEAVWQGQNGNATGGYPLVINFSFGRQAGQKDGQAPWETAMRALLKARRPTPTQIVMPAGNRNLSRGNARATLGTGTSTPPGRPARQLATDLVLPWAIPPADATSNFVEIWAKSQPTETDPAPAEADPGDFRLWVTPPGRSEIEVTGLTAGTYCDLAGIARVYCHRTAGQSRPNFVICVAPTLHPDGGAEAPAGHWTLRLRYAGTTPQECTFSVQTDDAGTTGGQAGVPSYFDSPAYRTHDEAGRPTDSYTGMQNAEPWDTFGPVQRKGTQNALASWKEVVVIGSYRDSDGRPALYSASFDGDKKRGGGRASTSVLYPGDTSPAHFGLLGAGARDGSVVSWRGTSMSAALATRDISQDLLAALDGGARPEDIEREFGDLDAGWFGKRLAGVQPEDHAHKAGAGKVVPLDPDRGRVSRTGQD